MNNSFKRRHDSSSSEVSKTIQNNLGKQNSNLTQKHKSKVQTLNSQIH